MAADIIRAPWTPEQVAALESWQSNDMIHPYTCRNRSEATHPDDAVLVPSKDGWSCPYCDFFQGWAINPIPLPPKETV